MLLLSLDNGGGAIIIAILPPFQSRAHHPSLILYGNLTCFIHNVALIVVEQMYHKHSKQASHVHETRKYYYYCFYYFVMRIPLWIQITRML